MSQIGSNLAAPPAHFPGWHRISSNLPWTAWLAAILFMLVPLLGLELRPLIPNGEPRYATVAWNMWNADNSIVPMLDGLPYGDKPPFLFIAIQTFWDLFGGPYESVARLVPPLMTAGCFLLIALAARRLWPERDGLAVSAPLVLLSFATFTLFGQALMFDGTLAFWTLLGVFGLITAARESLRTGFLAFAVGLGMGILTKGPVVLVFILLPALLYPLWRNPDTAHALSLRRWYKALGVAVLAGSLLPVCWLAAATQMAGESFGFEVLWNQTAGRVVKSFAHQKPWWFYVLFLPAIAFPWFFWSGVWSRNLWRRVLGEWQVRFLLISVVATFLILSLVSGKRVLYLVPLFPAASLLVSRLLSDKACSDEARLLAWIPLALAGAAACAVSLGSGVGRISIIFQTGMAPWLGPVLLMFAGLYWLAIRKSMIRQALTGAVLTVTLLVVSGAGVRPILQRFDTTKVVAAIPGAAHVPLAVYPRHHGEFGYAARRHAPIESLQTKKALRHWVRQNPSGYVIARLWRMRQVSNIKPVRIIEFGFRDYGIWRADQF